MKREIITLCGSTRFMKEFKETERALTLNGKIVLPPAIYGKAEGMGEYSEELGQKLLDLHLSKIDISDGIFVIDVGGYLGKSTKEEIDFTKKNTKFVKYYSEEIDKIKETLKQLEIKKNEQR